MFLRKLFNRRPDQKWKWVLVDLVIVILGVYCAFLIQSWAENEKSKKEAIKVYSALKYELEGFRYRMAMTSLGMKAYSRELKAKIGSGEYPDLHTYRFIQPQYDYQSIEYALEQNTDIVDFALYDLLQSSFVEVRRLEHTEELLTDTARQFKSVPQDFSADKPYLELRTSNEDHFVRFRFLIDERAQIADRVAKTAEKVLPLLNERLGSERSKAIEKDLILQNLNLVNSEAEAQELVRQFFPHFSEEEVRAMYETKNTTRESKD